MGVLKMGVETIEWKEHCTMYCSRTKAIRQVGPSRSEWKEHTPGFEKFISASASLPADVLCISSEIRSLTHQLSRRAFYDSCRDHSSVYSVISHTANMPHEATNRPTGSVIEAYAVFVKRLADSAYDLLAALGCIILYTIVIATFLILYISATFYIIITTLNGMNPRQEADLDNLSAVVDVQSGIPDEAIATTVDKSLNTTANRSLIKVPILQVNGRSLETEPQVPTTELLPAIPWYLKDYEFFYNTADMNLPENARLLTAEDGKPTYSRLTICGRCLFSDPAQVKSVLQHLELERVTEFSLEEGIIESCESVRGKLELGDRVYVGQAVWLLRVLEEVL